MALLKAIYDSEDDIPAEYRPLFTERDGKFEVAEEIEGVKTDADVARVQEALRKEKSDHKAVKEKLGGWGDLVHEEVRAQLDRIPELEAQAAAGGADPTKLDELVTARMQTTIAPLERTNAKLVADLASATDTIGTMTASDQRRQIHDAVRTAATSTKILETAMEDALMLGERVFEIREDDSQIVTRDNVGVTPGLKPADWLAEIQDKRPHWWPASKGGGAGGSGNGGGSFANNPWTANAWNITDQGKVVTEKGMETAVRMATAAGSKVGATKPTVKP